MIYAVITVVVVILVAIFGTQGMYTQDETQLSVVTRFGEIKRVHTTPGLKFKAPFIDAKHYFDKRLLRVDLPPARLPDVDTQFLNIDAYVRYRIGHQENGVVVVSSQDVKSFFETLGDEARAADRIERIVASRLRDAVAQRKREGIIGAQLKTAVVVVTDPTTEIRLAEALIYDSDAELGDKATVPTATRQEMLTEVQINAEQDVRENQLGITLVDVRIKRADFPPEAQQAIFGRMRAERERLAREFRAEGQRERDKIEADVNKRVTIIEAQAERQAEALRGEGEAEAIRVLKVLDEDPEFFAFRRNLQAYRKFLSQETTVVLSSDSELFQYLDTSRAFGVSQRTSTVGEVDNLAGNLWSVGGVDVHLDGGTDILVGKSPSVGDTLFVEGEPRADGGIRASHVSRGAEGRLQAVSKERQFTVAGRTVTTTDSTQAMVFASLVPEVYVEGRIASASLVATRITEGVAGELSAIEVTTWTVGGADVTVDDSTDIEAGADQQGQQLVVSVARQADGSLLALKIRLQMPPEEADVLVGPAFDILDEWQVEALAEPLLVGAGANVELGADQAGLEVLVGFQRLSDGSLRALRIRVAR